MHSRPTPSLPAPARSLTRPERRGLPVVVVVGKAREAWHAARVVVLQPLEQLSKFLLAFLLPQQPYLVLLLQTLPGGTEDHIHFGPSSVAHPSGRATVYPRAFLLL